MTFIKKFDESPRFQPQVPLAAPQPQTTPASPAPAASSPEPSSEVAESLDMASVQNDNTRTYAFAEQDLRFGKTAKTAAVSRTSSLETADPIKLGNAARSFQTGHLALEIGELDVALDCYQDAFNQDPESSAAAYYLGLCHHKRNEPEQAQAMFELARGLDPLDMNLKQRLEHFLP